MSKPEDSSMTLLPVEYVNRNHGQVTLPAMSAEEEAAMVELTRRSCDEPGNTPRA
jgi:hypothetical protein